MTEVQHLADYVGVLPAELAVHFWGKIAASATTRHWTSCIVAQSINGKPFGLFIADLVA